MQYEIRYLAYGENAALKKRSLDILRDFFGHKAFSFVTDSPVLFIASGGSEQFAIKAAAESRRILLLCHRESNSFAGAMEIAAYCRDKGVPVTILDVFAENALNQFEQFVLVDEAIQSLRGQKGALIGEISDWLISSAIDPQLLKHKTGIQLIQIPWHEAGDYKTFATTDEFLSVFAKDRMAGLEQSARVYAWLTSLIEKYDLDALSLECFPMVREDKVTACLPLSLLNSKQIVASCEGDLCSMVGSMLVRAASGMIPWQANIAHIKPGSILFAHCTAPVNMLETYTLDTHYETQCGTAISGQLKLGDAAAFRIHHKLDRYMLLEGEIQQNPDYEFACRTQIVFETTETQTEMLLHNGLGNHHLIFPAAHIPLVTALMEALDIERLV